MRLPLRRRRGGGRRRVGLSRRAVGLDVGFGLCLGGAEAVGLGCEEGVEEEFLSWSKRRLRWASATCFATLMFPSLSLFFSPPTLLLSFSFSPLRALLTIACASVSAASRRWMPSAPVPTSMSSEKCRLMGCSPFFFSDPRRPKRSPLVFFLRSRERGRVERIEALSKERDAVKNLPFPGSTGRTRVRTKEEEKSESRRKRQSERGESELFFLSFFARCALFSACSHFFFPSLQSTAVPARQLQPCRTGSLNVRFSQKASSRSSPKGSS